MRKCFFILLMFPVCGFSQTEGGKYWIRFTDKNNSPYSVLSPLQFLSQRAIDRRNKQKITVRENDLPVNPSYLDSIRNVGAIVLTSSKWMNGAVIQLSDSNTLPKIQGFSFVASIAFVQKKTNEMSGSPQKNPSGKFFSVLSSESYKTENYNYASAFNQIDMLGGVALHDSGYQGQGMVIAVLDAGFWKVDSLAIFDSIRKNRQILGTRDLVTGDTNVYDGHRHGMEVLSVIAGNKENMFVGTAPKASYWLLRSEIDPTENIIEEYFWIAAAEFADSAGADIISSSLGYNTFDNSAHNHVYADMNGNTAPVTIGADMAAAKGMLVVNSAGNEGTSSWKHIIAPADGDSVLAVGAVDTDRNHVSFSSMGPSSNGRIKPDVAAQGQGTVIASPSGGTMGASGTSFACPLVSGLAACLWQAHPEMNNTQILNAIRQSADHYNNPDSLTGYGIPNFTIADMLLSGTKRENFSGEKLIKIFPNPFGEKFAFDFYSDSSQKIYMEMYDVIGKKVLSDEKKASPNSYTVFPVNAAFLEKGIYFLRITSMKNKYVYKMVKM